VCHSHADILWNPLTPSFVNKAKEGGYVRIVNKNILMKAE
jgi:hypothetical protein